jgi:hypothetical protein
MNFKTIKQGNTSKLFWDYGTPLATVTATLMRTSDTMFYDVVGAAWSASPIENACTEDVVGLYSFAVPALDSDEYIVTMQDGVTDEESTQITVEPQEFTFQHIEAGSSTAILWPYGATGKTVTVTVRRDSDGLYWNESTELWGASPYDNTASEELSGIYKYTTPNNELDGYYLVEFSVGTDVSHTFRVYAGDLAYTSTLNVCRVYGTIVDVHNVPVQNALIQARAIPVSTTNNIGVSMAPVEAFTDASGYFSMDFIRSREYILIIPSIGLNKQVTIPDQASVELEEL